MRDYTWLKTDRNLTNTEKQKGYQVDVWVHDGRLIRNRLDIDDEEIRELTDNFKYMHAINEIDEDDWDDIDEDDYADAESIAPMSKTVCV